MAAATHGHHLRRCRATHWWTMCFDAALVERLRSWIWASNGPIWPFIWSNESNKSNESNGWSKAGKNCQLPGSSSFTSRLPCQPWWRSSYYQSQFNDRGSDTNTSRSAWKPGEMFVTVIVTYTSAFGYKKCHAALWSLHRFGCLFLAVFLHSGELGSTTSDCWGAADRTSLSSNLWHLFSPWHWSHLVTWTSQRLCAMLLCRPGIAEPHRTPDVWHQVAQKGRLKKIFKCRANEFE